MPPQSHIARAIDELETERTHLEARMSRVNEAIATLRDLFHLPGIRAAQPRRKAAPRSNGNGHGEVSADAIRNALKAGPLSPGQLCQRLGVDRAKLRYHLRQLEASGVVIGSGTTVSRRFALPGTPAKEAP